MVEVMVSLTASLLLFAALSYLFLGSRQLGRTHSDLSRMQESGRVGLEILGRAIRQAGSRTNAAIPFAGTPLTAAEGAAGAPDSISVQYTVQEGGESDCMGNAVAAGAIITYVFAIDTATSALTCTNGTGAAPIIVIDNIENMQITYGIDSNADGALDAYQSATGLNTSQVAAVRISMLVRGPSAAIAATNTQSYTYNGATVNATDGVLRQVYTSTFTVRNQAK